MPHRVRQTLFWPKTEGLETISSPRKTASILCVVNILLGSADAMTGRTVVVAAFPPARLGTRTLTLPVIDV